jgi:hypothetical protein
MSNRTVNFAIGPQKDKDVFDTGLDLNPGDTVRVQVDGKIVWNVIFKKMNAFPEGVYPGGAVPLSYNPANTLTFEQLDDNADHYLYSELKPYSLGIIIGDGETQQVFQGNRDKTIEGSIGTTGRIYLTVNKNKKFKEKWATGTWAVTVERTSQTETLMPVHATSPIRFYPDALIAKRKMSSFSTAFFWYIMPRSGIAERYVAWDVSLPCPDYINEFGLIGNFTPAGVYLKNHDVDLSSIPSSVKNDVKAPDLKAIRLDWGKVLSGYYQGAYVEVFEADPEGDETARFQRTLWVVGEMGEAQVGDNSATIEISPLTEFVNRDSGRRIQPICDVRRIPGETFGRGRCYNEEMHDGPNIANLTRGGIVTNINSLAQLTLNAAPVNGFPPFENGFKGSYGRLIGVDGKNKGVIRDVGGFDSANGLVTLRRSLPLLPDIGDTFNIEAGCDGTMQMCKGWNNLKNARFFIYVPGQKALLNRYRAA